MKKRYIIPIIMFLTACSFSEPLESNNSTSSTTYFPWEDDPCAEVIQSHWNKPESWLHLDKALSDLQMECDDVFNFEPFCEVINTEEENLLTRNLTTVIIETYLNIHDIEYDCSLEQTYVDVILENQFYWEIQQSYCSGILWERKGTYFCPHELATNKWWDLMLPKIKYVDKNEK